MGIVLPLVPVASTPAVAAPVPADVEAAPPPAGGPALEYGGRGIQPLSPARLLDTRAGEPTVDGQFAGVGSVGGGSTLSLQVTGRGGVPDSGVGAVVLNVTATEATRLTYVTVWPSGEPRPVASNLNPAAGATAPNLVVVKVGAGGQVDLYNRQGTVHLIADVAGWFPEGAGLNALSPARLLDTRAGEPTVDGQFAGVGSVGGGSTLSLQVTGRGGVPDSGVGSVVLNVTATEATRLTYVTVWPSGEPRPVASNLNPAAGATAPNLVVVKVGAGGQVDLYNRQGTAHLIADVAGWFPEGAGLNALSPARLLDTRAGEPTVDGQFAGVGAVAGGSTLSLQVTGRGGVPDLGVGAVVLNVTATEATRLTYVTVWPSGEPRPVASNLNPAAGDTAPNLVVVKVGAGGQVDLYNRQGTVHLIADVAGWFPDTTTSSTSITPAVGTVLAGFGDVASIDGDTVVLTGSADVPPVGGYLAVFPNPAVPDGFAGEVVTVTPNGDGTTTLVTSQDFTLEEVFHDLRINDTWEPTTITTEPSEPAGLMRPMASRSLADGAPCSISGTPIAPSVSVSLGGDLDFDLHDRHMKVLATGTAALSLNVNAGGSLSCSFPLPEAIIGLLGPMAIGIDGEGTVTISAALSTDVTLQVDKNIGFEYDDGTLTDLSSSELSGNGFGTPQTSASLGFSVNAQLEGKLFGIAGLALNSGPSITGIFEQGGCTKIEGSYSISGDLEAERWGIGWTATLAQVTVGPVTLYRSDACGTWSGGALFVSRTEPQGSAVVAGSHRTFELDFAPEDCQFNAIMQFVCDGTATFTVEQDITVVYSSPCPTGGELLTYVRTTANSTKDYDGDFEADVTYQTAFVRMSHNNDSYEVTETRTYQLSGGCTGAVPPTQVTTYNDRPWTTGNPYFGIDVVEATVSGGPTGSTGSGTRVPDADTVSTGTWGIERVP